MIRFRHTEDEKRYLALLSAVYVRVGQHLPPAVASEVMRNLGKLQTLLLLEGVTQGAAVEAAVRDDNGQTYEISATEGALAKLAAVYGSHDTPLVEIERALADDMGLSDEQTILGDGPLQFAPDVWEQDAGHHAPVTETEGIHWHKELPPEIVEALRQMRQEQDQDPTQHVPPAEGEHGRDAEPAFLDRVRDELQSLQSAGWEPDNWQDLIMTLHIEMKTDASFLDIQLSSDVGRTVLQQCGIHIDIPTAINMGDFTPRD